MNKKKLALLGHLPLIDKFLKPNVRKLSEIEKLIRSGWIKNEKMCTDLQEHYYLDEIYFIEKNKAIYCQHLDYLNNIDTSSRRFTLYGKVTRRKNLIYFTQSQSVERRDATYILLPESIVIPDKKYYYEI